MSDPRKYHVSRLLINTAAAVAAFCMLAAAPARAQFAPTQGTGTGLAETVEAIDSAGVTTRILYVTAHPDDESASILTYLARGLHAHVALLSLTRGEGGQNALGPEQAPQLGLIRTQELLAATRGYGVRLYFTRAPDFGYSKTPEETERIWGDTAVEDMVRVIREFRPSIIINNWGGVHSGHGHHQAAGLLTPRAAQLAGDDASYPGLKSEGLSPWRAPLILDLGRDSSASSVTLPVDDVSPLYGQSYREMAVDAFMNHRTQGITGFATSPYWRRPDVLSTVSGQRLDLATLAEPLSALSCATSAAQAQRLLAKAREQALQLDWNAATSSLIEAQRQVDTAQASARKDASQESSRESCNQAGWVLGKARAYIDRAIGLAAGVELTAAPSTGAAVAGESFDVTTRIRCRNGMACEFGAPKLDLLPRGSVTAVHSEDEDLFHVTFAGPAPPLSVLEQLNPEPPPILVAEQSVTLGGYSFTAREPVTYIEASTARLDRVPLRIVPAYTVTADPQQIIDPLGPGTRQYDVYLRVHANSEKPARILAGLDVPAGWTASVAEPVEIAGGGDGYARIHVSPPASLPAGAYALAAFARRGDEKFSTTIAPLPSRPALSWSEPAKTVVHAFAISVPAHLRVGYVTAESEPVPDALRRSGIEVTLLDAPALAFGDLSRFDAIAVGVRSYELRTDLPGANQRLLSYVENGGTLVVQYQHSGAWDSASYAPYPAVIGNPTPRITDENAAVKFLKPGDPLLNRPNEITKADFNGWVQERGLYFWSRFDSRYTPLLAMHDPGEQNLNGALVYTHYGKGTYIYTGLAFFRQLPQGVPGAYRLFVNLLSASRER